jgi:hypothetical protein
MREFVAKIKDGRLPIEVAREISAVIKGMEGATIRLTLKTVKPRRTLSQNDYYKGFIIPQFIKWARQYGNNLTKETADQVLKEMVGYVDTLTMPDGSQRDIPKHTAEEEKSEMADFITNVTGALAVDWGLTLPPPPGTDQLLYRS